jgi:hypothetical protein
VFNGLLQWSGGWKEARRRRGGAVVGQHMTQRAREGPRVSLGQRKERTWLRTLGPRRRSAARQAGETGEHSGVTGVADAGEVARERVHELYLIMGYPAR